MKFLGCLIASAARAFSMLVAIPSTANAAYPGQRRNLNDAAGQLRAVDSASLTHWERPSYDALLRKVSCTDSALSAADRAARPAGFRVLSR